MSKAATWMPLYIGDYLADTMHLTGPQHGAYLLLLMHSWRAGALPDDDVQLAAIARTDLAAWRDMAATIRAFFAGKDGRLVQGRLERERERAAGNMEQRRAAAKASVAKRAHQREGNARSTDVGVSLERSHGPSPSPIQETTSPGAAAPPNDPVPDARAALWSEGLARLRRLSGKGDRAARALMGRLTAAADDDCALVASLLHEAERDRPGDPVAWITAAIATRTGRRAGAGPPSKLGWMLTGAPNAPPPPHFDLEGFAEDTTP